MKKIKKLYKNFFFKVRTEGWKKALYRIFIFIRGSKYFALFFKKIFLVKDIIYKKIKRYYKKKMCLTYREKRLKTIKITKNEANRQIKQLKNKLTNNKLEKINQQPLVSIIVLNRDGLHHLKRLTKAIKKNTAYSNYELIVIDNVSNDGSIEFLEKNEFNLPIKLIKNQKNTSFSGGCNQGVQESKGELLVFMNNDIQPLSGWLHSLVKCYFDNENNVGSIGGKLIYPKKEKFKLSNRLQHVGIKFEFDQDQNFYRPYNFGTGESILDYNDERKCPALTAALLLISRKRFEEVNRFDEQYFYGYEDVDLGLKLIEKGYHNIFCPEVCAFHYEFGTQSKDNNVEISARREKNLDIFKKKWNRFLIKNIFENRLESKNFYCEENLTIYLSVDKNKSNTNYAEALKLNKIIKKKTDWNVKIINSEKKHSYKIGNEVDIIISFSEHYNIRKIKTESAKLVKIAWTRNDFNKWEKQEYLASFDIIVTSSDVARDNILEVIKRKILILPDNYSYDKKLKELISINKKKNSKPKIAIKIPTSNWQDAESWGDYYFAVSLEKYFRKNNWEVIIQSSPDWDNNGDSDCLSVLVLRGLSMYKTKPYHFNMMWNISHPDMVTEDEYKSYNHVFIASDFWAKKIQKKIPQTKVTTLLQCTDHEVFKKPISTEVDKINNKNSLFVGNSRKQFRESVMYAVNNGFDVSIYGKLWETYVDKKYIKAKCISNKLLYVYYNSAPVLLNDHWKDMAQKGFVSNRIFDALAVESILLTDDVVDMPNEIKQYINIYKNEKDFVEKLSDILLNQQKYREKVATARDVIINNYSFEKRAEEILSVIEKNIEK